MVLKKKMNKKKGKCTYLTGEYPLPYSTCFQSCVVCTIITPKARFLALPKNIRARLKSCSSWCGGCWCSNSCCAFCCC